MGITSDPNDPSLREILPSGQQKVYLVLSNEEIAKGFVRPVRRSYKHLLCDSITTMVSAIAETYARNPKFYSGTFCVKCGKHFNLINEKGEPAFLWDNDNTPVGS